LWTQSTPPPHHLQSHPPPSAGRNQGWRSHRGDPLIELHPVYHFYLLGSPRSIAGARFQCASSSPASTVNPKWAPSLFFLFSPSDRDPRAPNKSLTRRGINWSWPPRSTKIQRHPDRIHLNQYAPVTTRHGSNLHPLWFKLDLNSF
jgi:hypothetical protein